MAGIAQVARELGHSVTGSDAATYPPMSTLLESLGIEVREGFDPGHIPDDVDVCIVGNAMTRGNPEVEYILGNRLEFMSGPEWLRRAVLGRRRVIAVAGTHGKTTTTSMICHVLEQAGRRPGFLVGGVPGNFPVSARLGDSRWFVVEADEYDSAFFDKRSKFVHYFPEICVLNNLEFDHADIFTDLEAIKVQFHHLVRTIAGNGTIIANADDDNIADVLARGNYCPTEYFSVDDSHEGAWRIAVRRADYGTFDIIDPAGDTITIDWPLFGVHNAANALAAAAACRAAGIDSDLVGTALGSFVPPKRRLQLLAAVNGVSVYEDFAHHPTAIARTLEALAARHPGARLVAVLEPRSNTMRTAVHKASLGRALSRADECLVLASGSLAWDPAELVDDRGRRFCTSFERAADIAEHLRRTVQPGDIVVLMSNGAFEGLPGRVTKIFAGEGEPRTEMPVNRAV